MHQRVDGPPAGVGREAVRTRRRGLSLHVSLFCIWPSYHSHIRPLWFLWAHRIIQSNLNSRPLTESYPPRPFAVQCSQVAGLGIWTPAGGVVQSATGRKACSKLYWSTLTPTGALSKEVELGQGSSIFSCGIGNSYKEEGHQPSFEGWRTFAGVEGF